MYDEIPIIYIYIYIYIYIVISSYIILTVTVHEMGSLLVVASYIS